MCNTSPNTGPVMPEEFAQIRQKQADAVNEIGVVGIAALMGLGREDAEEFVKSMNETG